MKNVLRFLIVAAFVTAFALPAFAQTTTQTTQTPAASGPCGEVDAKAALYGKFRENFKGTPDQQKVAYEAGNIDIVLLLARAGYGNVSNLPPDKSLNAEASRMARRAVELIESGKAPAKWDPFPNQAEALGFLYYAQGVFTQETDPAAAAAAFIKAAQSNSLFKNESSTYTYLATIYETTELKKLVDQYNVAFPAGAAIPDEKKPQYDQMLAQIG